MLQRLTVSHPFSKLLVEPRTTFAERAACDGWVQCRQTESSFQERVTWVGWVCSRRNYSGVLGSRRAEIFAERFLIYVIVNRHRFLKQSLFLLSPSRKIQKFGAFGPNSSSSSQHARGLTGVLYRSRVTRDGSMTCQASEL